MKGSVYGDITWTGFVGDAVPQKYIEIFEIVRDARNAALDYVKEAVAQGKQIFRLAGG
ncbi:MAG: M24 family metallopeptidase [Cyanobacteriota/Melainabacteria group bacterium]